MSTNKFYILIKILLFIQMFSILLSCGEHEPDNVTSQVFEAYEANRYEEVIELLKRRHDEAKLDVQLLTIRAKSYFYLGKFDKAASDFEQLQKLNLLTMEARYFLAQSYDSLQYLELADLEYNKIMYHDSTNISYLLKSASIKKRLGDLNDAKKKYRMVITLDSSNHLALNNLGVIFEVEMNYSEAVKCYAKAIGFNDNEPFYYFNRGVAYLYLRKYQLALEDLNLAIKLENDNGRFHLNRGFAFYYLGNLSSACLDWKKAYSLNEQESVMYLEKYCEKSFL